MGENERRVEREEKRGSIIKIAEMKMNLNNQMLCSNYLYVALISVFIYTNITFC